MKRQWLWAKARYGQGFVEYAVIFLIIVLAVFGALALIAPRLAEIYSHAGSAL